jgi:hypothetical protein
MILGCLEMLTQYTGDSTATFAPMLAEPGEASPHNITFAFELPRKRFSMA